MDRTVNVVAPIPPTVLVTAVDENKFHVRITNTEANNDIVLNSARFDFLINSGSSYSAQVCLRVLGSSNLCGGIDTS